MTLDEAIRHCIEVVRECEEYICRNPEQLAEWLKDYKRMKAHERGCDGCKYLESVDNELCWTCDENYSNWESEKNELQSIFINKS